MIRLIALLASWLPYAPATHGAGNTRRARRYRQRSGDRKRYRPMRDGIVEAVGAGIAVPPDAWINRRR
jgi:hypothetical protein